MKGVYQRSYGPFLLSDMKDPTSSPWFTLFLTMFTIVNPVMETPYLDPDWTMTLQLLEYVPYS